MLDGEATSRFLKSLVAGNEFVDKGEICEWVELESNTSGLIVGYALCAFGTTDGWKVASTFHGRNVVVHSADEIRVFFAEPEDCGYAGGPLMPVTALTDARGSFVLLLPEA
jgi:hypothetical protein